MFEHLLQVAGGPTAPAKPNFVRLTSTEFITASALITQTGDPSGNVVANSDTLEWFLIRDKATNKVVVICAAPVRSSVVYGTMFNLLANGKPVTIAGCQWNCKLMNGDSGNPNNDWDRYICGMAATVNHTLFPLRWAELSDAELGFAAGTPGITNWVIPARSGDSWARHRGNGGQPAYEGFTTPAQTFGTRGWRPYLEYVSGELPW